MRPYSIDLKAKLRVDFMDHASQLIDKQMLGPLRRHQNNSFSQFTSTSKKNKLPRKSISLQLPFAIHPKIRIKTVENHIKLPRFLPTENQSKSPQVVLPRLSINVKEKFNFKTKCRRLKIRSNIIPGQYEPNALKTLFTSNPLRINKPKIQSEDMDARRNSYYYQKVKEYYEHKYDWKQE